MERLSDMNTLLIGYDLNKPGQDYADLIAYLKGFAYWHHLDSTWLIRAEMSASDMRDKLTPYPRLERRTARCQRHRRRMGDTRREREWQPVAAQQHGLVPRLQ